MLKKDIFLLTFMILVIITGTFQGAYTIAKEKYKVVGYNVGYQEGYSKGFDSAFISCGQGYHIILKNKCPEVYNKIVEGFKKVYPYSKFISE